MEGDESGSSDVSLLLSEPIDDFLTVSDIERIHEIEQSFVKKAECVKSDVNMKCVDSFNQKLDKKSKSLQTPSLTVGSSSSHVLLHSCEMIDHPHDVHSLMKILEVEPTRNPSAPACLPASNNWPGDCGFNIDFHTETNDSNCLYSEGRDKLYVTKGVPCAFKFVVSSSVPSSSIIRVMSIYMQPAHANSDVIRCLTHALADFENNIDACDHIIRCENVPALYVRNRNTLRRSLIVPYKSPASGFAHSVYYFKFTCLSSCPGGMNRRPIKVIFTLENGGEVIGRRSVEVKICSTPSRDIKNDDKRAENAVATRNVQKRTSAQTLVAPTQKKKKLSAKSSHMADIFRFIENTLHAYKNEQTTTVNGQYTLIVHDREHYELLLQAKALFEFAELARGLGPEVSRYLINQKMKKEKKPNE